MIICIVGPSCAGKTTTSEYIRSETGTEFVEASDYVRASHAESEHPGDVLGFVATRFNEGRKTMFAERIWSDVSHNHEDDLVICGFRAPEEVAYIERNAGQVVCFGIDATTNVRFLRNLTRREGPTITNYVDFYWKDMMERGFGISELLGRKCERIIVNERSFSDLYRDIDRLILEPYITS